jgi:apolipoprotein D and lipocalin family protein
LLVIAEVNLGILMKKQFFGLLTLLITSCMGVPENIKVVESIDANQYLGTWYEIARLDHSFERNLEKVTATYSLREDGSIKVINRGLNSKTNEWKEAEGKAYFVDPPNADKTNTGKLKVSFFGPFYGAYNIMVLDKPYYNYVMICGPDKSYLWILARTPQLTYPIKQHLIAQAKELGFDTEKLIHVPQTSEIINYKAGPHVN